MCNTYVAENAKSSNTHIKIHKLKEESKITKQSESHLS